VLCPLKVVRVPAYCIEAARRNGCGVKCPSSQKALEELTSASRDAELKAWSPTALR